MDRRDAEESWEMGTLKRDGSPDTRTSVEKRSFLFDFFFAFN